MERVRRLFEQLCPGLPFMPQVEMGGEDEW